ncbi:glycosyltransferase family 4 protein [Cellulomonas bogoriensis]|uniref:D-inositol 3-phosphate glycosyltransferase n=1 Tax=Cellulomonas bogoriensis 69B4 = DSM 16987 TaxID=1386082 RepID=A0A0A0BZL4_9CELL|nr:glycosyltransferase family 4 protein [Cellulomonas bogoriensis]KGM13823.1 glycosyl transferase family 1 [Cellulomonas bogoriensis 69B4 = DSM 16987]
MHVALVTHHYSPEVGAPQRRWGALVPRFVAAGHRVTVLTPPPHYPSGRAEDLPPEHRPGAVGVGEHGERVVRVRFREHGPTLVSRSLDQCVAAGDSVLRGMRHLRNGDHPDVVIATVPGIPSIGAGVALRRAVRAPLVVEMRDAWPDLIEPAGVIGRSGWKRLMTTQIHRAMTRVQRDAAAVVTTTEAFAGVLEDRGVERVEVVRNGAYLEEIPHLGARPDDASPFRVLYLGTVGRSQGLAAAVKASAILKGRGVAVDLRIVGPGADLGYLTDLADRLSAPTTIWGPVPREDVFDHFRWADTLLVSLRDWPPFHWTVPSKLYECMATGRHVTGALAGEAAEIVRGAGGGDVVPPQDPTALADLWEELATDPARRVVSPLGQLWAREHTDYDVLATKYLRLLHEVTA